MSYENVLCETIRLQPKDILINRLNEYKKILNAETIEYLNSLIELEFSVMKGNISEAERHILSQLDLYINIAIYNIYYRTLNLIKNSDIKDYIRDSEFGDSIEIFAANDKKIIKLFEFNYRRMTSPLSRYDIPREFKNKHIGEISLYKTITKDNLNNRIDNEEIKFTNYAHNLLLNDYELTNEGFKQSKYSMTENNKVMVKRMDILTVKDNIKII